MTCHLCGLPTPTPPIEAHGHSFCCVGCREVFQRFGEDILARRDRAGGTAQAAQDHGTEAFLRIEGMHCASCEVLIEQLAERIDGVYSARSSYATATARVIYDKDRIAESDLPGLMSIAGYTVGLRSDPRATRSNDMALFRVVTATSLSAVVMMLYLAFYYPTHLGIVDYAELEPVRWLAFGAAPLAIFVLTTIMVGYVGIPVFRGAWVGLRAGVLNMDNLLSIAILAAYAYSAVQYFRGDVDELYFDVAAAILTVVTLGRYFEAGARASAAEELDKLMTVWTPEARVTRDGHEVIIPLDALEPGEAVIVGARQAIPVDGVIKTGSAAINTSLMTGEPFPVHLGPGDPVQGGTLVVEGEISVATNPDAESHIEALTRVLWEVQSGAAGMRGLADRLARGFVPMVLVLAAAVSIWFYTSGSGAREAMLVGLATLIVSCPCTFGLAMPLATAAGVSAALRRGIIFTSPDIFERPRRFDTIIFDKTGTLSTGNMSVVTYIGPPEAIAAAAAVERLSSHPIAEAIAALDQTQTGENPDLHPGRGLVATVVGQRVAVGSRQLFAILGWDIPAALEQQLPDSSAEDGVLSFVGWDGTAQGAFLTRDTARDAWRDVVGRLRQNARVVLLSGAEHLGGFEDAFDTLHGGVPPEAKAAIVRHYRKAGTVAMIGDGSNDAPALAEADLSIAFGAPTSLATEAADVVIPGDDLNRVFDAFGLVAATRRRIRQNLVWALLYNATAIPLALSGVLNPLFAALAMSSSSLLVVWNSSRALPGDSGAPTKRSDISQRATLKLARE